MYLSCVLKGVSKMVEILLYMHVSVLPAVYACVSSASHDIGPGLHGCFEDMNATKVVVVRLIIIWVLSS